MYCFFQCIVCNTKLHHCCFSFIVVLFIDWLLGKGRRCFSFKIKNYWTIITINNVTFISTCLRKIDLLISRNYVARLTHIDYFIAAVVCAFPFKKELLKVHKVQEIFHLKKYKYNNQSSDCALNEISFTFYLIFTFQACHIILHTWVPKRDSMLHTHKSQLSICSIFLSHTLPFRLIWRPRTFWQSGLSLYTTNLPILHSIINKFLREVHSLTSNN